MKRLAGLCPIAPGWLAVNASNHPLHRNDDLEDLSTSELLWTTPVVALAHVQTWDASPDYRYTDDPPPDKWDAALEDEIEPVTFAGEDGFRHSSPPWFLGLLEPGEDVETFRRAAIDYLRDGRERNERLRAEREEATRTLADPILEVFRADDKWRTADEVRRSLSRDSSETSRIRNVLLDLVRRGDLRLESASAGQHSRVARWRLNEASEAE